MNGKLARYLRQEARKIRLNLIREFSGEPHKLRDLPNDRQIYQRIKRVYLENHRGT